MRLPQRLLPQASISSIMSFEEKYFLLSFPSFLQLAGACRTVLPPDAVLQSEEDKRPSSSSRLARMQLAARHQARWRIPLPAAFMIRVTIHAWSPSFETSEHKTVLGVSLPDFSVEEESFFSVTRMIVSGRHEK